MKNNHHDEIIEALTEAARRHTYEMALDRGSITVVQTPNGSPLPPIKEPTDAKD